MPAKLEWNTSSSQVLQADLAPEIAKISRQTENMLRLLPQKYDQSYASLCLPYDQELVDQVAPLVKKHKARKPRLMIVIGIGGSSLGIIAVQQALLGSYYNALNPELAVYYVDSVDSQSVRDVLIIAEAALVAGEDILCVIITKSGSTTETIANAQIFITLLQKMRPRAYAESIVVITDKDTSLHQLALDHEFDCLVVPDAVGGRYSVFSAVGLFPLAMLAIDIDQLRAGARYAISLLESKNNGENLSAQSALYAYWHYAKKHRPIHDLFLFSQSLLGVGSWYRQLVAESLGKKSRDGKLVGIMPTISLGTSDLHSMVQLYLGGPDVRCTTFVTIAQPRTSIDSVPSLLSSLAPELDHKSLQQIMRAIFSGVQTAYGMVKRPFVVIELPELTAFWVGVLLQVKMIEVIYLGDLLDVNPFDQPDVELYKKTTKRILSNE